MLWLHVWFVAAAMLLGAACTAPGTDDRTTVDAPSDGPIDATGDAAFDVSTDTGADLPNDLFTDAAPDSPTQRCAVPPGADPRVHEAVAASGWTCTRYLLPLQAPREIAEAADGTLYVTEQSIGRIVRVLSTSVVPVATGLSAPIGLRVAHDGMLWVAEEGRQSVARVDPATGARTVIAGGLRNVTYLDRAPDGTLFVASFEAFGVPSVVHRIDPGIAPARVDAFATGFFVAEGVVRDSDGSLVVAEWGGPGAGGPGRVTTIAAMGGPRSAGRELITGLSNVYGIARGPNDDGYLVSAGDRVIHLHADGRRDDLLSDVAIPSGMVVTSAGDVLVLEHVDIGHSAVGYLIRLRR